MGRTIPSATQLIFQQVKDAKPVYDILREQDQIKMDELFDLVIQHTSAVQNAGSLTPLEFTLTLMVLEVYKSVDHLRHEVYADMREMFKELALEHKRRIIEVPFKDPDETIPRLVS